MLPVKVVMADDEPGVMLLLCSILSKLERALVIGAADNAKDAIALVREHNPDLAFLDIELPDIKGIELAERKGIELAERLREIKPDLAIVFITAHQEYSLDAFKLYAFDYILKPIDEERVKSTFQRIYKMLEISKKSNTFPNTETCRISIKLIGTVISGFLRFWVKIRFFPRTMTFYSPNN